MIQSKGCSRLDKLSRRTPVYKSQSINALNLSSVLSEAAK